MKERRKQFILFYFIMNIKSQKKNLLIQIFIELLFGLLFLIFPTSFQNFIIYVIGSIICLIGIVSLIQTIKMRLSLSYNFSFSILMIIFGILLMIFNNFISSLIPVFISLFILVRGLTKITTNVVYKKINKYWIINIVLGGLMVAFSIALLILDGQNIIGYLIGSAILLNCLFDIFSLFSIWSLDKTVDKLYDTSDVIDVTYEEKEDK